MYRRQRQQNGAAKEVQIIRLHVLYGKLAGEEATCGTPLFEELRGSNNRCLFSVLHTQ